MAELVIVHIVEVRQLRQRGPLLHQVPTARRPANRLQDVLGGEGWEIHALGSGQRDGFTCPSHVLGPHSGHRLHPAFRIRRPALRSRPADGFPVYGKTIALIYKCIPGLGICFGIRRHRSTSAAHYTATRLHAYGATRRRPTERREGRPWAPSGHAPIFERGAVGASRKPSVSAGLYSKSGGAAENPRPEPRGLTCIPADSLRKHKKKGTGVRVRGNPCQDLRHRDDRVEYI